MLERAAIVIFLTTSLAAAELPLVFERNNGQADDDVRFVSRAGRESVALLDGGAFRIHGIEVRLAAANQRATISGIDLLPGRSNYFAGADPRRWHANIEQFGQVHYSDVYPGVDLAFHGHEYDFIVAPHSDPSPIRLVFPGDSHPQLDKGDLIVPPFRQQRPRAYQTINGERRDVAAAFVISGNTARFHLGPYDRRAPLVIDPTIIFATYLGGSGVDVGNSIAVDQSGNIYVAGMTSSTDFPVTTAPNPNELGAFVTKLSPDGSTILYSTVLGGAAANGIVVDANGNAYVTGVAGGSFPTTSGAYQSSTGVGFITKLSPTGQLLYSALIGGSPAAIAVDSSGAAYVTGSADSSLVATPGAFQTTTAPGNCPQLNLHEPPPLCANAFVLKLKPDGSAPVYTTFLGGVGPDGGAAIAVDAGGNAVVTGMTASNNFPVTANALQSTFGGAPPPVGPNVYGDAFVTKLNPAGSALVFSTYLGGSGEDSGNTLAIDPAGYIYVSGATSSPNFPVTPGALLTVFANAGTSQGAFGPLPSGFVVKLAPNGSGLSYGTYTAAGNAIGVDQTGYVYLYGSGPPPVPTIKILNQTGSALVTSGGSGVALSGSAPGVLDGKGFVYQTGQISPGQSFFATSGVVQPTYRAANYTAYVTKIALANTPQMWIATAVNAATQLPGITYADFWSGNVAPGEIITIYGTLLGPDTGVAAPSGSVPASLGGVKVLFDGTPAPLLWVQSNQINAIVPFEVQAPTTAMSIEYGGSTYGPVKLPVESTVPGIFTINGSGGGQAAVLNQDGTLNSASNPAAKGSIVSIYATGAGLMNSLMTDGAITPSIPPFPVPLLNVQIEIGGLPASVQYAGAAPGLVAGAIQVNAYVPAGAPSGGSIPVVLNIGGYVSSYGTVQPASATIAIQ
jgi:uncharacterized protein (TIGR03437 family)